MTIEKGHIWEQVPVDEGINVRCSRCGLFTFEVRDIQVCDGERHNLPPADPTPTPKNPQWYFPEKP